MAYDPKLNENLSLKLDPDLKGSVDFDFFGANTPRDNGSNNNAFTDLGPNSSKKSNFFEQSTSESTRDLNRPNLISKQKKSCVSDHKSFSVKSQSSETESTLCQPPNSPDSSSERDKLRESIHLPDPHNYDYSSDSDASSYCSSLSKSESLPRSINDKDGTSDHHDSRRSDSTGCSASSLTRSDDEEDDFRPRSPSPTPREIREPSSSCSRESQKSSHSSKKKTQSKSSPKSQSHNNSPIRKTNSNNIPTTKKISQSVSNIHSTKDYNSRELKRDYSSSSSSSDVTDVSPLSTNGSTSPVSLSSTNRLKSGDEESSMISSDYPQGNDDRLSVNVIMRALMEFDRNEGKPMIPRPSSQAGNRQRNQSFSAERCRDIDAENQRLLSSLLKNKSAKSNASIEDSDATKSFSAQPKKLVYKRPYHSALNRQKQQRKIEEENKRILQRIHSVRATPGLVKQNQFRDYMKVASMGGSNIHDHNSTSGLKGKALLRSQTDRPQSSLSLRPSSASTRRGKEPIITERTKAGSLRRCRSACSLDRYDEPSVTSPTTVMSNHSRDNSSNQKARAKPVTTAWSAKTSTEPMRPGSSLGHPPASPSRSSKKSSKNQWPAGW